MKKHKLFYDSEFTELSRNGRLISLAFVSETGRCFYAEFNDYEESRLSRWIQEHVLGNLKFRNRSTFLESENGNLWVKDNTATIADKLREWIDPFGAVEVYADCPSYDWVFFCDLFGSALKIPESIFYIPFDLATFLKSRNIDPDIQRESFVAKNRRKEFVAEIKSMAKGKHNALFDAMILKAIMEILDES